MAAHAVPASIGPVLFGRMGNLITARCPRDFTR
jgi:hypothetical protein